MRRRTRQICLCLIGTCILFAGLAGAVALYVSAGDERADTIGYQFVGGQAYAVTAQDSKAYRHDLERFGGKAAVFADDLNRWFASVWTGKPLACILAVLAIALALVCFRAAARLPPVLERPPPDTDGR